MTASAFPGEERELKSGMDESRRGEEPSGFEFRVLVRFWHLISLLEED